MRILILSDIHANLTALEAVLADAGEVDAAWCLGDLVGYGPDPNECIARIRSLPNLVCILGNHDAAVIGQLDDSSFIPEARQALPWTRDVWWEGSAQFLKGLPEKAELDGVTLAHGSPRQPIWEYLLDPGSATRSFEYFEKPYCFVGHTHLPVIFQLSEENSTAQVESPVPNTCRSLSPRAILNPGSVGQPRDRDARAAYALYDSDQATWEFRRTLYPVVEVQRRMEAAHLPGRHIQRLAVGW